MTRENHLMELLGKAYASLPDSEPLKADIFALAKDLEKNEHDQLARTKLAHAISMYLLTHKLKTSPEITALYKEIADSPEKYKGHAATAIMLGSLFHPESKRPF